MRDCRKASLPLRRPQQQVHVLADRQVRHVSVDARQRHQETAERDVGRHLLARALVVLVDLDSDEVSRTPREQGEIAHLSVHHVVPVVREPALDVCPPSTTRARVLRDAVRMKGAREGEGEFGLLPQVDQIGVDLYSARPLVSNARLQRAKGTDVEGHPHVVVLRLCRDARDCQGFEGGQQAQTSRPTKPLRLTPVELLPICRAWRCQLRARRRAKGGRGAPLSTSETLKTSVKMIADEVDAAAMLIERDEAVSG